MARTLLSPERLAQLHAEGRERAGRFVNPCTISQLRRVLTQRGEPWAASVLLRPINRRSRCDARLPWLEAGEEEILVLADAAETAELLEAARA